jgi:hypothetical protein
VQVISTIVAKNVDKSAVAPDVNGTVVASFSLVQNTTGATLGTLPGNITGQDPLLVANAGNPVANGGPTATYAIPLGSPAVDTGFNPSGLAFDQRGTGFPRISGAAPDIGAFEFTFPPTAIAATSGSGQSAQVNTAFANPLVVTVTDAAGNPLSGITVTFAAPATGASATFPGGTTATSNALGQVIVNVTANATAGPYTVTATAAGLATPANFNLTNTTGTTTGATIVSLTTTTANGTYGAGTAIPITVTFSSPVTLAGGNLTINLNDGGTATITPFSNATSATGTYTVAASESANPLDTNSPLVLAAGATLKDAGGNNVPLTFTAAQSLKASKTIVISTKTANFDKLGAYRPSDGSWSLDSNGGRTFGPTSQVFFHFSPPGVTGVAGDWNGTGRSAIGDFSNGVWHLDLKGNGQAPDASETFQFGQAGDQPVVGNWDGNPSGRSELGVFRTAPDGITGEFILDIANHKTIDSSNLVFTFGFGTDHIVVGDWNGNGTTKVGVYRDAKNFIPADAGDIVFSINSSGDHATFTNFIFGLITDKVVIGDWTGDGKAKVGVYRDGSNGFNAPGVALFSLDSGALMFNAQSQVFLFGFTSDQFVAGNWPPTPPLLPAQFAAGGVGPGGVPALTDAELAPVLQRAIADWAAHGADPAQLASIPVHVGTLDGSLLGWTDASGITLATDAAGWGWNLDPSDAAFRLAGPNGLQALLGTPAAGQMDLLTVVEHELGHELGLSDVDPGSYPSDLMAATLPTGTRRIA